MSDMLQLVVTSGGGRLRCQVLVPHLTDKLMKHIGHLLSVLLT